MLAESERRAYLDALGVDVWRPRDQDAPAAPLLDTEAVATRTEAELLSWPELQQQVATCTRCDLHKSRTQTVFGVGSQSADWMIIGEAPGAEEDRRGEPFVGRAGKLLDEMLRAVGLARDSVYIANTLKCRPPNNRDPSPKESESCREYLQRQIQLVSPKLILVVGRIAAQQLLKTDAPLGRLRGRKHFINDAKIPLIVTYHPAYLLRSPGQKQKSWEDLCLARGIVREYAE